MKKTRKKSTTQKQKLSNHEKLEGLCRELDVEMDGVSPIPATAAAILNGIRRVLGDIDDEQNYRSEID